MDAPRSALRETVAGRGLPLRGNDIDTDQIIPARYLKSLTFEGLGQHLFADARAMHASHPLDQLQFAGASILVVERNFGCGSSREHAPRSLQDWGIRAVIGISFAEIFHGNSTAIGLPCVCLAAGQVEDLLSAIARDPSLHISVDLRDMKVRALRCAGPPQAAQAPSGVSEPREAGSVGAPSIEATAHMPRGPREQLLTGTWDSTAVMLQAGQQIEETARLPYIVGF